MLFARIDPIQDAADAYAAQLIAELSAYRPAPPLPSAIDWPWIFSIESELLRSLPDAELRRRAWNVYDRYADVVGAEKAARRAASSSLNAESCDVSVLRADLLQVHSETARQYTLGYEIERERGLLTRLIMNIAIASFAALIVLLTLPTLRDTWQAAVVSGSVVVMGVVIWAYIYRRRQYRRDHQSEVHRSGSFPTGVATMIVLALLSAAIVRADPAPAKTTSAEQKPSAAASQPVPKQEVKRSESPAMPIGPLVALAGILGATFSILQRAQRSAAGTDPVAALFSLRAARRQAYLSLVSGAISALVVFCVFAGGMVQGSLFPKFVNEWSFSSEVWWPMKLFDFFNFTGPMAHADHGKLLVWCFIAGFAERFVPDMLDKFTKT